jgi:hypothetical protein
MQAMAVYSPGHLFSNEPPDLSSRAYRFLAEGDSWFSLGALNPAKNSNLLFEMSFERSACAVNCASPGDTLRRMSQANRDPVFVDLLCGRRAHIWDGLLLSCGGNDLIDAAQVRADGVEPALRLLLKAHEWGPTNAGASRYLSDAGWQTFCTYLEANLAHLLQLRDRGPSRGCPVFMHGYAIPTPRPAGAGLGIGPWLYPSVQAYGIPVADQPGVARLLLQRLGQLLSRCAADSARFANLNFFDTSALPLVPARSGTTGEDGDWVNEIHLTWRGYEKLALPWSREIEKTVRAQRGEL